MHFFLRPRLSPQFLYLLRPLVREQLLFHVIGMERRVFTLEQGYIAESGRLRRKTMLEIWESY